MNYSFFACALFAFAALGCIKNVDADSRQLVGRWKMSKVTHQGSKILRTDLPGGRYEVEIEFLENGEIEGTTSQRTFSGNYKVNNDSINIEYWPYTKVGETDWGEIFDDNIRLVTTFFLIRKSVNFKYQTLYLHYVDGEMIFDRIK